MILGLLIFLYLSVKLLICEDTTQKVKTGQQDWRILECGFLSSVVRLFKLRIKGISMSLHSLRKEPTGSLAGKSRTAGPGIERCLE